MMEYLFLEKKSFSFYNLTLFFYNLTLILLTRTKGADMKKVLCLAVFALGLATPAVAADWVWLGNDSNNTAVFGDADSRTDNSAWVEMRYAKPKKHSNGKFYNTDKGLEEIDCSGKRRRSLTVTWYSKSGNSIGSDTRSYAEWDYVIPGTVGENMYKFVCNRYPR